MSGPQDEYEHAPDFYVTDHGSIILVHPITPDAEGWFAENVADDAPRMGNALAVERRYAGALIEGMESDGLILERARMH